MVIILQYIHILNHYIVHLKLIKYYMSIIPQFKDTNITEKDKKVCNLRVLAFLQSCIRLSKLLHVVLGNNK